MSTYNAKQWAALRARRLAEQQRIDSHRRLRQLDDPGGDPEPETQRSTEPGFCAMCTAPVAIGAALRPLGRGDALVKVCSDCDGTHPRDGDYGFASSSKAPEKPSKSKGHV